MTDEIKGPSSEDVAKWGINVVDLISYSYRREAEHDHRPNYPGSPFLRSILIYQTLEGGE
jgi:hypothetical protein